MKWPLISALSPAISLGHLSTIGFDLRDLLLGALDLVERLALRVPHAHQHLQMPREHNDERSA